MSNFKKFILKISDFLFQKNEQKENFKVVDKNILTGSICGNKVHTTFDATLTISSKDKQKDLEIQNEIQKLLIENQNKAINLFNYMKNLGTPIIKNKNATKILSKINEELGFIYPKKGLEALYLNLIFNKKFAFETKEMFVVENYEFNIYTLGYEFYKWYCYKANINGYQQEIQNKYKHIFEYCDNNNIAKLSYNEILELKTAIKRDVEAINFITELAKKTQLAKESLDKIKLGKKVKV